MKLLVIRPEPDGARSAGALRARGHAVVVAPLARIEPIAAELGPGPFAAVLISSANAVRAMEIHPRCQELTRLPVIAVGRRSGQAARRAGFADVISPDGTVQDLVDLVGALYGGTAKPLLYLAGADRARDLVGDLAGVVPVEMAVVYQAVAIASLPADVAAALRSGRLEGVLHFSRRSAEIYLAAATAAGLAAEAVAPVQFCLSARIAEVFAAASAPTIRIAAHPSEESLLQRVDSR